MDKETMMKYAPWLVIAIAFFMQYNLFVTPVQLEQKHRQILEDVSKVYTTKSEFDIVKGQLVDVNKKLDKIYDILTGRK